MITKNCKKLNFPRLRTLQQLNIGENSNSDNDSKNNKNFFFDVKCDILPTFKYFSAKLLDSKNTVSSRPDHIYDVLHFYANFTDFCVLDYMHTKKCTFYCSLSDWAKFHFCVVLRRERRG